MKLRILLPLVILIGAVAARPGDAHADVGVGLFLGEPTGFTLKLGLQRNSSLEFLAGVEGYDDDRGHREDWYFHGTWLVTPWAAQGESVVIPIRLGIGAAVYEDDWDGGDEDLGIGVRAPFQLAFQFRSAPIELYLELSLLLRLLDDEDGFDDDDDFLDLGGGLGFRVYF